MSKKVNTKHLDGLKSLDNGENVDQNHSKMAKTSTEKPISGLTVKYSK